MDKILLENIKRINELIGISKEITLTESIGEFEEVLSKKLFNTLEKLFVRPQEKNTQKGLESLMNSLEKIVGYDDRQRLENIINNRLFSQTEKEIQIIDLLSKNKILQQTIKERLIADKNFSDEIKSMMDSYLRLPEVNNYLNQMYEAALANNSNDIEAAKTTLRNIIADDIGKDELERYFETTTVKELPNGSVKIEFNEPESWFNPSGGVETDGFNGPGLNNQNVQNTLIQNKKRNFSFKQEIQSIIKSASKEDLQTVLRAYRRAFTPMYKLQAEFNYYAEKMSEQIKKGERYDSELKKMKDILISTKKVWNSIPEQTYNEWLNNLPENVKKTLGGYGETAANWKIFMSEIQKQEGYFVPLKIELNAYAKLWPFRLPGFDKPGWFIFKKPQPDLLKRIGNLVAFRDPRTLSEIKQALLISGSKQDIAKNILIRLVQDAIVVPAVVATFYSFVKPPLSYIEAFQNLFTEDDKNWINYDEPDETGRRSLEKDKLAVVEMVINDWYKTFKSYLPDSAWRYLRDVVDFTLIDEFVMASAEYFGATSSIENLSNEEYDKKIKEYLDGNQKKFNDWYNSLDAGAKKTFDDYRKKLEGSGKPVPPQQSGQQKPTTPPTGTQPTPPQQTGQQKPTTPPTGTQQTPPKQSGQNKPAETTPTQTKTAQQRVDEI